MKLNRIVPAVVLGLTAVVSAACTTGYAYGQPPPYRNGRPYYDNTYYREVERRAYDNGFREGSKRGERDARSNRRYEPQRYSEWRNADDGFRREYGDPNAYRRYYRNGFEAGYSRSYQYYDRGYRRY